MSGALRAAGEISLDATAVGGLPNSLPSGTPSLMFYFLDAAGARLTWAVGALVSTESGEDIRPGADALRVQLDFLSDSAEGIAVPGAKFDIWLGRFVGHGQIIFMIHDDARATQSP